MSTQREQRDVIEVLTRDHRRVEDMIGTVIALPRQDGRRRYVVAGVITELVRHAAAEERYLYPAVRALVPDGERLAEQKLAEHALTLQAINDLHGLDPADARFDEVFSRLAGRTQAHLQDEENELFPRLAGACDQTTLRDLGTKVERAKKETPVWPSPDGPEIPVRDGGLAHGLDGSPGPRTA